MSRRRHVSRAVTASAGIALVAAGGFGLLAQPHAEAASVKPSSCITILIPIGCSSSSAAPTSSAPASGGTSPSAPTSAPTTIPSDQSSQSINAQPTTYSIGAQPQANQTTASGPAPGPNLSVSNLVIRKSKGKLDARATVTNTGTVLLQNVPLSVSASGVGTQHWTITLNPGQHITFHTRWPFRASPRAKKVVVTLDPQNLIAETSKADDRVSRTKRFR